MPEGKTILLCPLNWGIGHASRCIPIIRLLQKAGHKPIIAAVGKPLSLLKEEFPDLIFEIFPGYEPVYANKLPMVFRMAIEAPKIIRGIEKEQLLLRQIIEKHSIDAVISDNRFGAYSEKIPSVFITHQLFIQTPALLSPIKPIIKALNFRYIKKFNEVWVPDFQDNPNLSGILSHGNISGLDVKYIGPLSRFSGYPERKEASKIGPDLLVLLSGPEPQRTILENILIRKLKTSIYKTWIIRGLPGESIKLEPKNNLEFYNHLDQMKLGQAMNNSKYIIARAGYSTIMDLYALGKKAILIPTPGQTEQEYLAKYLNNNSLFTFMKQKNINLSNFENNIEDENAFLIRPNYNLEEFINKWISTI
jgi:uncharacterized protein (TIGR00661 family)